jgi:hypothetical protein
MASAAPSLVSKLFLNSDAPEQLPYDAAATCSMPNRHAANNVLGRFPGATAAMTPALSP